MNETEVLRISGNVTVPKFQDPAFKSMFESWIAYNEFQFAGNIVPQDDPSGMRLYRVEDVEAYQRLNHNYEEQIIKLNKTKSENDKLTLSLSEELAQEREKYYILKNAYEKIDDVGFRLFVRQRFKFL
jgi:hypothetical protein